MDSQRRSDLSGKVARLMLENEMLREKNVRELMDHMETMRMCAEMRARLDEMEREAGHGRA